MSEKSKDTEAALDLLGKLVGDDQEAINALRAVVFRLTELGTDLIDALLNQMTLQDKVLDLQGQLMESLRAQISLEKEITVLRLR